MAPEQQQPQPQRTPEQIRASIEANRVELGNAVAQLRGEVGLATNWRYQLEQHKKQVMIGAAVAGFVIGGGLAIITRRKRNRR